MKRISLFFALFLLSASAVFSLEIPLIVGLGTLFDYNVTTYQAERRYETGLQGEVNYSILGTGAFAFLDFRYVEFSFGFNGLLNFIKGNGTLKDVTNADWYDASLSGATINLSLIGKYPFTFTGYEVYPLFGIEGRICISMRYREDSIWDEKRAGDSYQGNASDWSSFWFKIGGGADFYLGTSFFIRTQLVFGIKLNTARENAIVDLIRNSEDYLQSYVFGAGGKLVLAVGYNFGSTNLSLPSGGGGGGKSRSRGRTPPASDGDIYRPYPAY